MRRRNLEFLNSPAVAALLLGLLVLASSIAKWQGGYRPRFPLEHSNVAYSLASGTGYSNPFGVTSGPTAWVPPGIPLAYAGAVRLAKALQVDERAPIVGINVLAAATACFLVLRYCLGNWRLKARGAFLAVYLGYGILDPDFLVSSGPLTAAASALLLAGLAEAFRQPGRAVPWAMIFGANALLSLIHPGLALAGVLASLSVGLVQVRLEAVRPTSLIRSALFAAIAGVAMGAGPWTIRNYLVFHQWIPAKSNGYFEMVLSQRETGNGVLSEASLLVGHPSTNPRLLSEYVRLGERRFLEPYQEQAREILRSDFRRYCIFSLNRLLDAVCFCQSPADIEMLSVHLKSAQAARLVGQRLIIMCAGTPNFFWARSSVPASVELSGIRAAGIDEPEAVLADWARAQKAIQGRTENPAAVLTGFAWSGLPTLFIVAAFFAARWSPPRLVLAATAIYLVALVPNVLITHDMRHQGSFVLLFAVLGAGAVETILSRRKTIAGGRLAEKP